MRVLVAEDRATMRDLVCKMLQKLGYEVVSVEDGQDADADRNRHSKYGGATRFAGGVQEDSTAPKPLIR